MRLAFSCSLRIRASWYLPGTVSAAVTDSSSATIGCSCSCPQTSAAAAVLLLDNGPALIPDRPDAVPAPFVSSEAGFQRRRADEGPSFSVERLLLREIHCQPVLVLSCLECCLAA